MVVMAGTATANCEDAERLELKPCEEHTVVNECVDHLVVMSDAFGDG